VLLWVDKKNNNLVTSLIAFNNRRSPKQYVRAMKKSFLVLFSREEKGQQRGGEK
jgi:hypothetical protein